MSPLSQSRCADFEYPRRRPVRRVCDHGRDGFPADACSAARRAISRPSRIDSGVASLNSDGIVAIDCFAASVAHYAGTHVVVAVDVIRATTTAVTAVASGRRCFVAPTLDAAVALAETLERPLLVGELGGNMPFGFDLTNSPAGVAELADTSRPIVLVSSSGTSVMSEAQSAVAAYVGSLRGYSALAEHLAASATAVAVIGAGTRGEFREEDQLCCAWIAAGLIDRGFRSENEQTSRLVERWRDERPEAIESSASAEYLRRTAQLRDLEFILAHVDDLSTVFSVRRDEVVEVER